MVYELTVPSIGSVLFGFQSPKSGQWYMNNTVNVQKISHWFQSPKSGQWYMNI